VFEGGNVGIGVSDPAMLLEIQTTGSTEAQVGISNTGTGVASLYFDASNGDFSGSDYAWIAQNNDLSLEITTGLLSDAPIKFKTNDAEAMRIDSSGNVGIGCTPESWYSGQTALRVGNGGVFRGYTSSNPSHMWLSANSYQDTDGVEKYIAGDQAEEIRMVNGTLMFNVAPTGTADGTITWTTAMTIDNNGNVLTGSSTATAGTLSAKGYEKKACDFRRYNSTGEVVHFEYNDGTVGSISVTGSATAYNTSSDYRLKENVVDMENATDRVKQLKPKRFNFIADDSVTVDGFIAHEVSDIVPEAISGEKDAMQTEEYTVSEALGEVFTPVVEEVTEERQVTETVETGSYVNLAGETITETQEVGVTEEATKTVIERQDIDGVMTEVEVEKVTQEPVMETVVTTEAVAEVILETDVEKPEELTEGQWRETTAKVTAEREVPDMQGIDQGKLVPLLVGALQEAIARIEELESK